MKDKTKSKLLATLVALVLLWLGLVGYGII